MPSSVGPAPALPRWLVYLVMFGLYLTLRGYHSRDGDQAYRLPILLHRQDASLFAADPFVRAFDAFNPHAGSLALLDWASRPLGLSAGLFGLFAITFLLTAWAIDRLARALWPEFGPRVGLVAVGLVFVAKAGNVGTNHLFEAMLLDRLMAYALAWMAIAVSVEQPRRGLAVAPVLLGLAALVHPSLGIQFALIWGASWVAWWAFERERAFSLRTLIGGLLGLVLALLPGLIVNMGQGGRLLDGLPAEEFRLLSVELQGPQHMLPHLWRMPQWLAWGCYLVLAALAWKERDRARESEGAKARLAVMLIGTVLGLGAAWVGVEVLRDLRVTLFQPFRMATLARGLALVLASGRAVTLWRNGRLIDRARVLLVTVGLAGDWALVVATLFDVAMAVAEFRRARCADQSAERRLRGRHYRTRLTTWSRQTGLFSPVYGACRAAVLGPPLRAVRLGIGMWIGGPFTGLLAGTGLSPRRAGLKPRIREAPWNGAKEDVRAHANPPSTAGLVPLRGKPRETGLQTAHVSGFASHLFGVVGRGGARLVPPAVLAAGLWFLSRHDTESGHVPLLVALMLVPLTALRVPTAWNRRRVAFALIATWAIPIAAFAFAPAVATGRAPAWQASLVERCRFRATPVDDIERLASWCRAHTPPDATFVGPPGPKTFRLWSRRAVAFNRAASPYHAAALGDWFRRFQDHVDDHSPPAAFVRAYQTDRHALERRYQALNDAQRAALARQQRATHVIAAPPEASQPDSPLELLHVEGRYAVYRVRPAVAVTASAGTE